jgi:uncharacterized protein YoxC
MTKILKFLEDVDTETKELLQEVVDFSEVLDPKKHEDFYEIIQAVIDTIPEMYTSMENLKDQVVDVSKRLNEVGLMVEKKGSV